MIFIIEFPCFSLLFFIVIFVLLGFAGNIFWKTGYSLIARTENGLHRVILQSSRLNSYLLYPDQTNFSIFYT